MDISALMMLPHELQLLLLVQIATVKIPRFVFMISQPIPSQLEGVATSPTLAYAI